MFVDVSKYAFKVVFPTIILIGISLVHAVSFITINVNFFGSTTEQGKTSMVDGPGRINSGYSTVFSLCAWVPRISNP